MERPLKRRSHYPSRKELDLLVDSNDFDKLNKRLAERTVENLLLDVRDRRDPSRDRFPFGISTTIALFMDIKVVLTMACDTTLFALIVSEDTFWKSRMSMDFPEFPLSFNPSEFEGARRFKKQPWRRLYYMVRYFFYSSIYKSIPDRLSELSGPQGSWKKEFYIDITVQDSDTFRCIYMDRKTRNKIGQPKKLTLRGILAIHNLSISNYLTPKMSPYASFIMDPNSHLNAQYTIVGYMIGFSPKMILLHVQEYEGKAIIG